MKMLKIFAVSSFAFALIACDTWTETESISLKEAEIARDHPELYAAYLANLRDYRNTDHKILYAWFDNITQHPTSRGQRIAAIPDSVDYVNLTNPDELSSWTLSDMQAVRSDKGMKFVYTISYPALEKEYEQYVLQNTEEETVDFLAYTADFVDRNLALVGKYGYDGISVLFYGMNTLHLTEAQKTDYLAKEAAFMSKFRTWIDSNPGKTFIFEGNPQNLADKSVLQDAAFIVIRTETLQYAAGLDYQVLLTAGEGVPTDRYVVTVSTRSFDPFDITTGYFYNAENELETSIPLAAGWVVSAEDGFTKAGLGVMNIQNDYYSPVKSYEHVREAIGVMNFSPNF